MQFALSLLSHVQKGKNIFTASFLGSGNISFLPMLKEKESKRIKKKKKKLHGTAQCKIPDEKSIVRLRELAKNLKCTS